MSWAVSPGAGEEGWEGGNNWNCTFIFYFRSFIIMLIATLSQIIIGLGLQSKLLSSSF